MATSMKHARIRLFFDNMPNEPSWMLIEHRKTMLIENVEEEISQKYFESSVPVYLMLSGCRLPSLEKSIILRDDDIVHVRAITSTLKTSVGDTQTKVNTEEFSENYVKKHKHKKKKKHRKNDYEENDKELDGIRIHQYSEDDEKKKIESSGKKRKHDDFSFMEEVETKKTEKKKLKITEEVDNKKSKKENSEIDQESPYHDSNDIVLDVNKETGVVKQSAEKTVVTDQSLVQKKKRKRKRKRKNGNSSVDVSDPNLSFAKEQSLKLAESLIQDGKNNYKCNEKTNDTVFRQRGKTIKPTNQYKKFDSGEESGNEIDESGNVSSTVESDMNQSKFEDTVSMATHPHQNDEDRSLSPFPYSSVYKSMDFSAQKSVQEESNVNGHVDQEKAFSLGSDYSQTDNVDRNSFQVEQNMMTEIRPSQCTSTLANGVMVYSRPRNRRERRMMQHRHLSKEEQLDTELTNRSFIYTNDVETPPQTTLTDKVDDHGPPCDINGSNDQMFEAVPLFKDYSKFPFIQGTPRKGDIIAYKIIEMSDMYTPEISDFKEAVVCNFDTKSQMIELEIQQQAKREPGKFDVVLEDEDALVTQDQIDKVCFLPWNSLMETRLVTK